MNINVFIVLVTVGGALSIASILAAGIVDDKAKGHVEVYVFQLYMRATTIFSGVLVLFTGIARLILK